MEIYFFNMRSSILGKIFSCFLIVTLGLFSHGCAKKSLPLRDQLELHSNRIVLIPSEVPAQYSLDVYANGRLEGAFKGAGTGAWKTFASLPQGHCEGIFCGLVVLVYLSATVVGGAVGSIHGAATSPSGGTVQKMEDSLVEKTAEVFTQLDFAKMFVSKVLQDSSVDIQLVSKNVGEGYSPVDYKQFKSQGFDQLINIGITDVEFKGDKGKNPFLSMTIKAEVKIVNLDNLQETNKKKFSVVGHEAVYQYWLGMDETEISDMFRKKIQNLIENIYNTLFVMNDLPIASRYFNEQGESDSICCWLCPVEPPLDYSYEMQQLQFPIIKSLQPRLQWSSFPSEKQGSQFVKATGKKIQDVTYDLRIFNYYNHQVYTAGGLKENHHEINTVLEPDKEHYWTVRACFDVNGNNICTKWARTSVPVKADPTIVKPNEMIKEAFKDYCKREEPAMDNLYRFKTPSIIQGENGSFP